MLFKLIDFHIDFFYLSLHKGVSSPEGTRGHAIPMLHAENKNHLIVMVYMHKRILLYTESKWSCMIPEIADIIITTFCFLDVPVCDCRSRLVGGLQTNSELHAL